jgi:prepilin-type N-terminal cleavage/methylation domain-containing protein
VQSINQFWHKNILKTRYSKGFTLAEILLVITIIGCIASVTIPDLVQDIQDQQLIIQWKSGYSILSRATMSAIDDNGGSFTGFANATVMKNQLKQYFIYTKDCATPTVGNCWANNVLYANGNPAFVDMPGIILNNGMFVRFYLTASNCNQTAYFSTGECGAYEIDVNGFKGPNIVGKDVFYVHILSNGIKPAGVLESMGIMSAANCANWGPGCGMALLLK